MAQPSLKDKPPHTLTKLPEVAQEWNYTNAPSVVATNVFRAIPMSGLYLRPEEDELANLPTVSACSAALPAQGSDGCGTARIWFGPKYTASTNGDGSMSTPAKRSGTTHGSTLKVGAPALVLPHLDANPS